MVIAADAALSHVLRQKFRLDPGERISLAPVAMPVSMVRRISLRVIMRVERKAVSWRISYCEE